MILLCGSFAVHDEDTNPHDQSQRTDTVLSQAQRASLLDFVSEHVNYLSVFVCSVLSSVKISQHRSDI